MNQPLVVESPSLELLLYRLDQQQAEIQDLKHDIEDLETQITQSETRRTQQEKRQLVAGVSFLGSIVFMLAGVIWSYRSVIFRGVSMANSRSCPAHSNKTLYTLFWLLLGLVLSLSVSLLVLLTLVLNPLIVRLNDGESVLIVVDPVTADTLSPLLNTETYDEDPD